MQKIPAVFLLVVLILMSCKKEANPTSVHGTVTNILTGESVGNIPIQIIECDGFPIKCVTPVITKLTDVNGKFDISFLPERMKTYQVEIGYNKFVSLTSRIYTDIIKNKENIFDFAQFPFKDLQLHLKIQRHDKNFLQCGVQAIDTFGYYRGDIYVGNNPTTDFDTTFNILIEAGRKYNATVILSNKTAPYTYIDPVYFSMPFTIDNVDTTNVLFVVQ